MAGAPATAPKLVYLPFRAMAETTRMLFAYGKVPYRDEAIWGQVFADRRRSFDFPWGKTPVLEVPGFRCVAQSGALARYAAKRAGVYPEDPVVCALSDSVYELAQELCTINPLVNCFVGEQFQQIRNEYFRSVMPLGLIQLEMELTRAQEAKGGGPFFAGESPAHGDFNVFHHVDNAETLYDENILSMLEEQVSDADFSLGFLKRWMGRMRDPKQMGDNGRFAAYLAKRPKVVDKGQDPGLQDRNGRVVRQRTGPGRIWLKDGLFFDTLGDPSIT